MKITMDSAGRIVIPKAIRNEAHLKPGEPLDIQVRDGILMIETRPLALELRRQGEFLVAYPTEPTAPLAEDVVNQTLREIRSR